MLVIFLAIFFSFISFSAHSHSQPPSLQDFKIAFGLTAADVPYVSRWGDYFNAIGLVGPKGPYNRGSGNLAMSEFNRSRFSQNPCFAKLAGHFYDEIQRKDLKFYSQNDFTDERLQTRASLADEAGNGKYAAIKPGWLWELALKYAHGNKGLAIQLLGVCGHDDTVYAITFPELNPQAEIRRQQFLDFYKQHYSERFCNFDKNVISQDKCFKVYSSYEARSCPNMTSLMYLPKSLGDKFDVLEKLKLKVTSKQAPTLGRFALPAKYYHIVGSAFSSCLALSRCPESFLCPKIFRKGHQVGVSYYRASSLCGELQGSLQNSDVKTLIEAYVPDLAGYCGSSERRNFASKLAKLGKVNCPTDWTSQRCNSALQKIETLIVDFEWSHAQHDAGIDFSEENCPKLGKEGDLLENSCEALKAIESSSDAGTSQSEQSSANK